LVLLKNTPCPDYKIRGIETEAGRQTKWAFLFSCFTGLRYSDIAALDFDQIKDGYLYFRQQKTRSVERIN